MKHDYLKEALKVLGAVIVILLFFALIPDFAIKYKHFNILSDIVDESSLSEEDSMSIESMEKDLLGAASDSIDEATPLAVAPIMKDTVYIAHAGVVGFEDFSASGQMLYPFYKALLTEAHKRPVRIGVLGDSFIEADIMTSQLRKQLQAQYGGLGVGFIPVTSPVVQSRKNIQLESSGWNTKSMVYYKNADWSKFSLGGFYYLPSENASVLLKTTEADSVYQVSFAFINPKHTKINVSINGEPPVEYTPEPSDEAQLLTFSNGGIQSLKVSVSNVDGFVGIGFYRSNKTGVYVDNFSVRGSSGVVLSTISEDLSVQLKKHVTYDLLIVEFGLNVMTAEKSTYQSYRKLMTNAVEHLKKCFPNTPIILMSVGDRGSKNSDGSISTHPGVLPLVDAQRQIAQNAGVLFWNTFQAMGGEKSMVAFVNHKPPMAGKDYTHINYLGGSKIADEFFESLMNEKNRYAPTISNGQ